MQEREGDTCRAALIQFAVSSLSLCAAVKVLLAGCIGFFLLFFICVYFLLRFRQSSPGWPHGLHAVAAAADANGEWQTAGNMKTNRLIALLTLNNPLTKWRRT